MISDDDGDFENFWVFDIWFVMTFSFCNLIPYCSLFVMTCLVWVDSLFYFVFDLIIIWSLVFVEFLWLIWTDLIVCFLRFFDRSGCCFWWFWVVWMLFLFVVFLFSITCFFLLLLLCLCFVCCFFDLFVFIVWIAKFCFAVLCWSFFVRKRKFEGVCCLKEFFLFLFFDLFCFLMIFFCFCWLIFLLSCAEKTKMVIEWKQKRDWQWLSAF